MTTYGAMDVGHAGGWLCGLWTVQWQMGCRWTCVKKCRLVTLAYMSIRT